MDATRTWSPQQEAIFEWFDTPDDDAHNLVVRARAGTGKTTTIIEGIGRAPEQNIILCAFNKRIATELQSRIKGNARAMTLHALGFAAVRRAWNVRVADGNQRAMALSIRVCGRSAPDEIIKMVAKLHTHSREMVPHAEDPRELLDIALEFDCDPTELAESAIGFAAYDLQWVTARAFEAMVLAAEEKPANGIDFADMLYLPVRNHWLHPEADMVVVDEAQDMTATQLELAQGMALKTGRIAIVGDDRQAIYGFRGADSGSIDRLKKELKAVELPLTTTYRCGSRIVAAARELVSDFECPEGAPTGQISSITGLDQLILAAEPDDFILSRKNAPLAKVAMAFVRARKRIRIEGKDIGSGLKAIINKMDASTPEDLIDRLQAWEEREIARFMKMGQEERCEAVIDRVETICTLMEDVFGIRELLARIDELFSDYGTNMVVASSVHKAKGLEADRVFILEETLMGKGAKKGAKVDEQEESNIKYVAITRARKHLVWVESI